MKKQEKRSNPLSFSKETLVVLEKGHLGEVDGGITPLVLIATFTVGYTVGQTISDAAEK